jgi:hypothetical protein
LLLTHAFRPGPVLFRRSHARVGALALPQARRPAPSFGAAVRSPFARFSRRRCPGFRSYGSPEARRRVLLVLSPSSVALGLRGSEFFHECAAIGFSLHVLGFGAAGRLLICLPILALGFAHRRAAVRSGFQSRALDLRAASGLVLGLRLFLAVPIFLPQARQGSAPPCPCVPFLVARVCAAAGRFSLLLVLPKPTPWFGQLGQKLPRRAPSPPDSPARESVLRSSTGGDCGRCCLSPQFPQTERVLSYAFESGSRRPENQLLGFSF